MKTSVILSTLAALCLIITFAESPTLQNTKNNNTTPADQFSYIHSNLMTANAEVKLTTIIGKRSAVRTAVKPNVDLSYLKFDVADYTPEMATEITDENSFEYLKFNVIDYTTTESDETPETPANEFEYLKFNVNDYTTTESDETPETPANEFEYLKFNVNDYTTNVSDETPETPANEFEYLKFNVNDYSNSDTYSNETIE